MAAPQRAQPHRPRAGLRPVLLAALCLLACAARPLAAPVDDGDDERLPGWQGERLRAAAASSARNRTKGERDGADDLARGMWLQTISWRPRAMLVHNFMTKRVGTACVRPTNFPDAARSLALCCCAQGGGCGHDHAGHTAHGAVHGDRLRDGGEQGGVGAATLATRLLLPAVRPTRPFPRRLACPSLRACLRHALSVSLTVSTARRTRSGRACRPS